MTLYDRNLREQTLFELFENPAYSETEQALREALNTVTWKIMETKGEWTRSRQVEVAWVIAQELKVPYDKVVDLVQQDIENVAQTVSLFKLDTTSISKLVNPNNLVQGYTMSDLFKTLHANHVKQLQVTLAAGVARGLSTDALIREIQTKGTNLTRNQLRSAIITTTNEARAQTRHLNYQKMEEDGLIDGYVYNATLDGRTTEYCRNHDGRTYWKPIREISNQINVHFRCRSVFVPTSKSASMRASIAGPVQDESYGKWFERQEESFQRKVLGRNKYDLYKEGRYKIGGLPDVVGQTVSLTVIASLLEAPDIEEMDPNYWEK